MQFRPSFDQPALPPRKASRKQINRVNRKDSNLSLMVSVKMRSMVRLTNLHVHANDYAKETTDFWHIRILSPWVSVPVQWLPLR